MFDCEITVKGDGVGRNGRFVTDKTGPLSRFMVDNSFLYPIVMKHIKSCDKCDPNEALRRHLNRRLTDPKFDRKTSHGLVMLALRYERSFKKTRPIEKELVDQFIVNSRQFHLVLEHEKRLSVEQLASAARDIMRKWTRVQTIDEMYGRDVIKNRFLILCQLASQSVFPTNEKEFEDLVTILEVSLS